MRSIFLDTVCCSLAKDQAISCIFKGKPEQRMPSGVCIHQDGN